MKINKYDDFTEKYGCGGWLCVLIIAILLLFGLSCLEAWVAMLLWNWILPLIWVGAPTMTFWPMWGLVELCSILFKSKNYKSNNE